MTSFKKFPTVFQIIFILGISILPNHLFAEEEPANPLLDKKILTEKQIAAGEIALFDGEASFGWVKQKGINWRIKNNTITANSGPIGLIRTAVPFQDFELSLECKLEKGGNSGIFIRSLATPKNPETDCYEINVADNHPAGYHTGSIIGHTKTDKKFPANRWLKIKIRAAGTHITVHVNGEKTAEITDKNKDAASRRFGYIGLQKNSGKVEFKNITLQPIEMTSLYNGKDLSGWNVIPGSKSQFTVEEGVIRSRNGLGFIETEKAYDNFLFQIDSKTHAEELNSGVFFRSQKGTEKASSNGYEMQIHNGYKEGDRNQPNNSGTGSIFRRTIARRIVAYDNQWSTLTLVAHGPDIACWVDGYMTTSWTDTRKPNANPRRGLRLEAGHFSLQGHDPTTDLSFRAIKISPYKK